MEGEILQKDQKILEEQKRLESLDERYNQDVSLIDQEMGKLKLQVEDKDVFIED